MSRSTTATKTWREANPEKVAVCQPSTAGSHQLLVADVAEIEAHCVKNYPDSDQGRHDPDEPDDLPVRSPVVFQTSVDYVARPCGSGRRRRGAAPSAGT